MKNSELHKKYPVKTWDNKDYPTLQYHAIYEYGEKYGRPHYHILLFNQHPKLNNKIDKAWSKKGQSMGFVKLGTVEQKSIEYCMQHQIKNAKTWNERVPEQQPPKAFMSRRPAIGQTYIDRNKKHIAENKQKYTVVNGSKRAHPAYYKKKIHPDKKTEHAKLKALYLYEQYKQDWSKSHKMNWDDTEARRLELAEQRISKSKRESF